METWVMRRMGAAFDPEKVCRYTGLALYPHPTLDGRTVLYWRTDGVPMRARETTPDEKAWIAANFVAFVDSCRALTAWLDTTEKRS